MVMTSRLEREVELLAKADSAGVALHQSSFLWGRSTFAHAHVVPVCVPSVRASPYFCDEVRLCLDIPSDGKGGHANETCCIVVLLCEFLCFHQAWQGLA